MTANGDSHAHDGDGDEEHTPPPVTPRTWSQRLARAERGIGPDMPRTDEAIRVLLYEQAALADGVELLMAADVERVQQCSAILAELGHVTRSLCEVNVRLGDHGKRITTLDAARVGAARGAGTVGGATAAVGLLWALVEAVGGPAAIARMARGLLGG